MTSNSYSARLGEIADAQFAAAVEQAGLGRFVTAQPITTGLFGQNVFLTTTNGEYVFRGAPHWHKGGPNDAWQFPKERLYAELLHSHAAPVAWPQILDASCDHFPWPYLIMPRLPGACLADREAQARLGAAGRAGVAAAMGQTLAALHTLAWPLAGDFDPDLQAIAPYQGGFRQHLADEIAGLRDQAHSHGALGPDDDAWLDMLLGTDIGPQTGAPARYVHNDYHLGNVLLEVAGGEWRVRGVVDLMTSCFGDPAADFSRAACGWFDTDRASAGAFLAAYRAAGGAAAPSAPRLTLLSAYERLLVWVYNTHPMVVAAWTRGTTFAAWARPYVERLAEAVLG